MLIRPGRLKSLSHLWAKTINTVKKMAIQLKAVYRFNKIPVKILMPFFT